MSAPSTGPIVSAARVGVPSLVKGSNGGTETSGTVLTNGMGSAAVQYPPVVFTMAAPNSVVRLGAGYDSIRGGFKGTYFDVQQEWIDDGSRQGSDSLSSQLATLSPEQQTAIQAAIADDITRKVSMGISPTSIIAGPGGGDGVRMTTSTTVIKKHSDMLDSLNISGNIAISMEALGSLKGSASYLKEDVQASTSLYFLIKVSIRKSWIYLRDEKLILNSEELKDVYEQDFVKKHGDCFVNGLLTGGDFFALLKSELSDQSNKEDITGSLEGKMDKGPISGSVEVNLKKNVDSLANSSSLNLSFVVSGGKPTTSPQTVDDLYAAAQAFIKDCQDHPVPIEVSLMPYGCLRSYRPVGLFRRPSDQMGQLLIQAKADQLSLLMDRYFICLNIRNIALNYAKDPLLFDNYKLRGHQDTVMDLPENRKQMVDDIRKVLTDVQNEQADIIAFLRAEDSAVKQQSLTPASEITFAADRPPSKGPPSSTANAFYAEFIERLPVRKDRTPEEIYWDRVSVGYVVLPPNPTDPNAALEINPPDITHGAGENSLTRNYQVNFAPKDYFKPGTTIQVFLGIAGLGLDFAPGKTAGVRKIDLKAKDISPQGFTLQMSFSADVDNPPERVVVSYLALPDFDTRAGAYPPFRLDREDFPEPIEWTAPPDPLQPTASNPPPPPPQSLLKQELPPGIGSPTFLVVPTAFSDSGGNKLNFNLGAQDLKETAFNLSVQSLGDKSLSVPKPLISSLSANWLALSSTVSALQQSAWRCGSFTLTNSTEGGDFVDGRDKSWRIATKTVPFNPRMGGNKYPSVFVAITGLQSDNGVHVEALLDQRKVSVEKFAVEVRAWKQGTGEKDPKLHSVTVSYLALTDNVK